MLFTACYLEEDLAILTLAIQHHLAEPTGFDISHLCISPALPVGHVWLSVVPQVLLEHLKPESWHRANKELTTDQLCQLPLILINKKLRPERASVSSKVTHSLFKNPEFLLHHTALLSFFFWSWYWWEQDLCPCSMPVLQCYLRTSGLLDDGMPQH